jgi:integrase
MMKNEIMIKLPVLFDAGGDLSKKWYILFYVRNPRTNKLERQRIYKGINDVHTIEGRYELGNKMLKHWTEKLQAGWSPLADQNIVYADNLEFQSYIKNYRNSKSKNGTFRFFASKYIDYVKNNIEESTIATYRSKLRLFDAWLEANSLNEVDLSVINNQVMVKFFTFIIEVRKLSKVSLKNYTKLLAMVFNYVKKERPQLINPVYDLPETKRINDNTPQPIQQIDILKFAKVLKEGDPQLWLGCCFLYYCFIRPGKELRLLKIGDIDFGRGTLRVSPENAKSVERIVGIPDEFLNELRDYYQLHIFNRNYFVFSKDGLPGDSFIGKNNLRQRFVKIRKEMNMPEMYKFYSWKHTGNVRAEKSGITLRELQEHNGHANMKTTENYLKNKIRKESERVIKHFPSIYK